MSLKAASHADLSAKVPPPFCSSSGRLSRSDDTAEEPVGQPVGQPVSRFCRRPVRAVRPVSALSPSASFLQISRLQGELVRKRKECEDLRQENKYLSNEIHMERIMMRTESELTMRNLRNLNQELQAQVKELKQKLHSTQQRATLCSRAAEEAEATRSEAERERALAEARSTDSKKEKELILVEKNRLGEELQQLKCQKTFLQHTDLQLLLAHTEKSCFEAKLKLERVSAERQVLLQENGDLEAQREELRRSQKQLAEEMCSLREKECQSRRRALAAEEQVEQARCARREAERERRRAEHEASERANEADTWRERHAEAAAKLRKLEDARALRHNKACQANIRSYFLCMAESDQRIRILKNQDGSPRSFTEGDPVYLSTPEPSIEERSSERTVYRVTAPSSSRSTGHTRFDELSPVPPASPEVSPTRRGRKVVEYFWLPTDGQ